MGKKIVLAVFGGIAIVGVLLGIVGYALGGRVASLNTRDGGLYFEDGNRSVKVANTPGWLDDGSVFSVFGSWKDIKETVKEQVYDHDYEYADGYEYEHDDDDYDDLEHEESSFGYRYDPNEFTGEDFADWEDAGGDLNIAGSEREIEIPFSASELRSINLNMDVGYIRIEEGDKAALRMQGPLPVESYGEDGEWFIDCRVNNGSNIKAKPWRSSNSNHFYRGDEDITTLFTLVLPKGTTLDMVQANIGMGVMTAKDAKANTLYLSSELGALRASNCQGREGTFKTELGAVEVKNANFDVCALDTELGAIDFEGQVATSMDIDCELGAVTARLPRPDAYSWEAKTDLGAINIDGSGVAGLSNGAEGGTPGATPHFDLDCNLGSIEVKFK